MNPTHTLGLYDVTVSVPDGPDLLTILDGLDLSVAPGEVVAVTGASGSGKSTLLAVAGLLRAPTSGAVTVDGVDQVGRSRKDITATRGAKIGLVFQSSNLFPSLTAVEQVELVAHMVGRLDAAARDRARELLDAFGLDQRRNARPAELSGGERQRVGIARALMNEPSLLLADEPTASLDDDRGREVMELLVTETARRHVATVIVTHNPAQLPGVHRSLHLAGGALHAAEPATA